MRRTMSLLPAALAVSLALAACGDDEDRRSAGGNAGATRADQTTASNRPASRAGNDGSTMAGATRDNPSPGASGAPSGDRLAANGTGAAGPAGVPPGAPPPSGSASAGGTSTGVGTRNSTGTGTSAADTGTGAAGRSAVGKEANAAVGSTEKRFVAEAASGGLLEVEAGRVAQERASSPAVKQFASRLVADHERANQELKQLAGTKGIDVPAEMNRSDRATVDRLRKLQGGEFDRAYMEHVGREHHRKDIASFERTARESNDAAIRGFAQKTLPVLREHLQLAQQTEQSLRGAGRSGPQSSAGSRTATGSAGGAGTGGAGGTAAGGSGATSGNSGR